MNAETDIMFQSPILRTVITLLALIAIPIIDFWWHNGITGFSLLLTLIVCLVTCSRLITWRREKQAQDRQQLVISDKGGLDQ
jgi:hypothetical protein